MKLLKCFVLFIVFAYSSLASITSLDNDISKTLKKYGLKDIALDISKKRVELESKKYSSKVTFAQALDKALESVIFDDTDDESPMGIAKYVYELEYDYSTWYSVGLRAKASAIVVDLFEKGAKLEFIEDQQAPERMEKESENWVFYYESYMLLGDHLIWVIVPRDGSPAYNYGY